MQMKKRGMSPCQVPCHLDRMGPVVVDAGGAAVGAGAEVAGAEVVASEPELSGGGMNQTWGWPKGRKNCGDKVDRAPAERMGRRRRHDTLRSARPEHGDPGG